MISVVGLHRSEWMRVMSCCISDFNHSVYFSIDISQVFMNILINCALPKDLFKMMYSMEIIDKIVTSGHSIDARWNILYCTALYGPVTLLKSTEMKER